MSPPTLAEKFLLTIMIDRFRVLVVVPARGGSKGIPKKNLYPVLGRPLISYTLEVCNLLNWVDFVHVSTDDPDIAEVAEDFGFSVPKLRPDRLSEDYVSDQDLLKYCLQETESLTESDFQIVIMLQPTTPIREVSDIEKGIQLLIEHNYDSVWSVTEIDLKYHALKQLVLDEFGSLNFFTEKGKKIIARQQLKPTYMRNGAFYILKKETITFSDSLLGTNAGAVILKKKSIGIDSLSDIQQVELLLKSNARNLRKKR